MKKKEQKAIEKKFALFREQLWEGKDSRNWFDEEVRIKDYLEANGLPRRKIAGKKDG